MKNKLRGARETERNSLSSEHGLPGNLAHLQSGSGRRNSFVASSSNSRLDKERKAFQDLAATVGIPRRATEEHSRTKASKEQITSPRHVSGNPQKRKKTGHHSKDSSSHIGMVTCCEMLFDRRKPLIIFAVIYDEKQVLQCASSRGKEWR